MSDQQIAALRTLSDQMKQGEVTLADATETLDNIVQSFVPLAAQAVQSPEDNPESPTGIEPQTEAPAETQTDAAPAPAEEKKSKK